MWWGRWLRTDSLFFGFGFGFGMVNILWVILWLYLFEFTYIGTIVTAHHVFGDFVRLHEAYGYVLEDVVQNFPV